ncbi:MAG: hypothetical protein IPM59_08655 [Chloracidobacterium sp.]|nr:hypothetical protein [Chloracidobacterium sp.]
MAVGRAFAIWLLIIIAESFNGALRGLILEPRLGDMRARQAGVFIGMALIFAVTFLMIRWLGMRSSAALVMVGLFWVMLTAGFEVGLGRALGMTWSRIAEDYHPGRGGLMLFGLAFMLVAPLLTARLRGIRPEL